VIDFGGETSCADLVEAKVLIEIERKPVWAYSTMERDEHLPLLGVTNALHTTNQPCALRHEKLPVIVGVVIRRQHDEDWASQTPIDVIGR
jgi:hypothetical protein